MKKLLTLCLAMSGLFFTTKTIAQDLVKGKPGMYPEQITFGSNAPVFTKGFVIVTDANDKAVLSNKALLNHSENDQLGFVHYRYQQTFSGIPVEHAVYIMHVKSGTISRAMSSACTSTDTMTPARRSSSRGGRPTGTR